jgi:hypothetical protein
MVTRTKSLFALVFIGSKNLTLVGTASLISVTDRRPDSASHSKGTTRATHYLRGHLTLYSHCQRKVRPMKLFFANIQDSRTLYGNNLSEQVNFQAAD